MKAKTVEQRLEKSDSEIYWAFKENAWRLLFSYINIYLNKQM